MIAEVSLETGGEGAVTVPIAVNGDSLNTWVLPALASLSGAMTFDVRRVDQDHSADLLRQGIVMAAVTASAEPVQGCSVTRLGLMRYRPMCSPEFGERWFRDGTTSDSLAHAPMLVFDRSDDLQDRYLVETTGVERVGTTFRPRRTSPKRYVWESGGRCCRGSRANAGKPPAS